VDDHYCNVEGGFRERIRLYQHNRAQFLPEGLLPFVGKWVAFSTDGKQIVASHEKLAGLESELQAMGVNPQEVLFEQIYAAGYPGSNAAGSFGDDGRSGAFDGERGCPRTRHGRCEFLGDDYGGDVAFRLFLAHPLWPARLR
jgi:hypothetical protein